MLVMGVDTVRLTNKKLREEKDAVMALQRKLQKRRESGEAEPRSRRPEENAVLGAVLPQVDGTKGCANCGKDNSPEWRTGPTGPRTVRPLFALRLALG